MYLVGTLDKWNNSKRSECKERYQHVDNKSKTKYISVSELIEMGKIESKLEKQPPQWWIDQLDQTNNKACG